MRVHVPMYAVYFEELSPEAYLALQRECPERIRRVTIRPPELGKRGYGALLVEYTSPVYRHHRMNGGR